MSQGIHWYCDRQEGTEPSFKRRSRRFLQIISHPRDAWLVVRLLLWAIVLPVCKRIVPLRKLTPFMWVSPAAVRNLAQERKIATIVRWIYAFIFPNETSCLERSLLLYRYLSSNNMGPRLVTGMRRTEDQNWKGHAWILVDGKPFGEAFASIQDFRPLIVFGPEGIGEQAEPDSTERTE
jgi:Transglutaminase-like superfamily